VDIRIGITQAPREIAIEVEDDAKAREALKKSVDAALKGETATLWITDKKGKDIAIPSAKIAYVEIGSTDAERRIGFGD
jgi:C4-type Zn-finger protein